MNQSHRFKCISSKEHITLILALCIKCVQLEDNGHSQKKFAFNLKRQHVSDFTFYLKHSSLFTLICMFSCKAISSLLAPFEVCSLIERCMAERCIDS